jgi:hypothetical protein
VPTYQVNWDMKPQKPDAPEDWPMSPWVRRRLTQEEHDELLTQLRQQEEAGEVANIQVQIDG